MSDGEIFDACKVDPWFLARIREIIELEQKIKTFGLPKDAANLRVLKAAGFSDLRLAALTGRQESEVAALRHSLDVRPVFKRIDTCAAEFASPTAYMYSTYEAPFAGVPPASRAPRRAEKSSFSGAGQTASGRASNSTIAAATPVSRSATPAMKPS